jgi:hypothetical protein
MTLRLKPYERMCLVRVAGVCGSSPPSFIGDLYTRFVPLISSVGFLGQVVGQWKGAEGYLQIASNLKTLRIGKEFARCQLVYPH